MKHRIEAYSDMGGRTNNEDAVAVVEGTRGTLLIVADGLGGHDCGEVASALAIDTLRYYFLDENIPFDPSAAISAANAAVCRKQAESGQKMKTTVSVAWIGAAKTVLAHVGDSRIYAFYDRRVVFQSIDHSAAQMAVLLGEINRADIRSHPDRNVLTRALGGTPEVKVDVTELPNAAYDALLLCTDGFWEYVPEREMCVLQALAATPNEWLQHMRKVLAARVPPKHDNHSAIAFMK